MILTIIMGTTVASMCSLMFWSIGMEEASRLRPAYRPTEREKLISRIDELLIKDRYEQALALLENKDLADLPAHYWMYMVNQRIAHINYHAKQLPYLERLEDLLKS